MSHRTAYVPNGSGVSSGDVAVRVQQVSASGTALSGASNTTDAASAARTATYTGGTQTTDQGSAVFVFLDVTATPNNAETLTVSLQGQDPVSAKWLTFATFTAVVASNIGATSTTATFAFVADPVEAAVALTANNGGIQVVQRRVPRTWRPVVTHSSTGSWTYSVGLSVSAT